MKTTATATYRSPAITMPPRAYGSPWLFPIAMSPGMKAKELPRKTGTLKPVTTWNNRVPTPAANRVTPMSSPVRIGTSTVAPNITKVCCIPSTTFFAFRLFSTKDSL